MPYWFRHCNERLWWRDARDKSYCPACGKQALSSFLRCPVKRVSLGAYLPNTPPRPNRGCGTTTSPSSLLTPINVLVWNVENLTQTPRPHYRGRKEVRIEYIVEQIRDVRADVVLLMETGKDGKWVVDALCKHLNDDKEEPTSPKPKKARHNDHGQPKWPGEKKARCNYEGEATVITGPDKPKTYGGETYTVLWKNEHVTNVALIKSDFIYRSAKADYRGCAVITLNTCYIAVLHAPSPGHPIRVRTAVLYNLVEQVADKYRDKPLFFCGDFNYPQAQVTGYLQPIMKHFGFHHLGPGTPSNGEGTSLKRRVHDANARYFSEPYDQVWGARDIGINKAERLKAHAEWFTQGYKDACFCTLKQDVESLGKWNEMYHHTRAALREPDSQLVKEFNDFRAAAKDLWKHLRNDSPKSDKIVECVKKTQWPTWLERIVPDPNRHKPMKAGEFTSLDRWFRALTCAIDLLVSCKLRERERIYLYYAYISDHLPVKLRIDLNGQGATDMDLCWTNHS